MAKMEPIQREWTLEKSVDESRSSLLAAIESLKGTVRQSSDTHIECDFGGRILSRMLGVPMASRRMLPKRVDLTLEPGREGGTRIRLVANERFGVRLGGGGEGKLTQALEETVQAIQDFSRRP